MLSFSIIRTSTNRVAENLVYRGAPRGKTITVAFSAVLVRHGDESFLFDTGLGDRVDAQYAADMPRWKRPLLKYSRPVDSVRAQLGRAEFGKIERIILSHSHWDHAGGCVDFPEAEVWVTAAELEFALRHLPPWSLYRGGVMPSQVGDPAIRWKTYDYADGPYGGYERSVDLFGDRSAVLVPMPGHTPGSTGLYLTTASGRQFLFCGDVVWNGNAVGCCAPKTPFASTFVDNDRAATLREITRLHDLSQANPKLTIVPAHDGEVHDAIGHFPNWIS